VKDGDDRGFGPEVAGIASELEECVPRRAEEQSIDQSRAVQRRGIQRVWQREDDMDVVHGEQLRQAGLEPALLVQGLTLGTVTVATGAPDRTLGAAIGTDLTVASEGWGATAFNGPQGSELLAAEPL
jgi:hypothetical protein